MGGNVIHTYLYFFFVLCLIFAFLLFMGVREKINNRKNVDRLKIRVNVNGIRGKSTVTRLITSILNENGFCVIGKTTGTAARLITPSDGTEKELPRRPEGANIKEQMKTIRLAAEYGADALVCECMAVRPEYQDVYQNKMLMANVTVIVNVVEDHLDVMGPTLDEIALAFSRSIPYNGILITMQGVYVPYFERVAKKRNTKVFIADNNKIPPGYLEQFEYILFPDNVALGLAFAEAMGIDESTAMKGMLKAAPDPGVLRIHHLDEKNWGNSVFVNGFAANEPESSLKIWELIRKKDELPLENPVILFNGRPDRIDRTRQFVKDFFPHLQGVTVVGMGQGIRSIQQNFDKRRFPGVLEYINLEDKSPQEIVQKLKEIMKRRLLLGVGNIHGDGHYVIEALLENNTEESAYTAENKIAIGEELLLSFQNAIDNEKIEAMLNIQ